MIPARNLKGRKLLTKKGPAVTQGLGHNGQIFSEQINFEALH